MTHVIATVSLTPSVRERFIVLTDELSPGVITCDIPFLYVLMPMRIE